MKPTFLCVVFLSVLVLRMSAQQPNAIGAPGTTHEFRSAVMEAIQDSDGMDYLGSEIEWQLERMESRKSASYLIRAADNDVELRIAGIVWDLYEAQVTCRLAAQNGASMDDCDSRTQSLRIRALAAAGINPARVYAHAP